MECNYKAFHKRSFDGTKMDTTGKASPSDRPMEKSTKDTFMKNMCPQLLVK